jgi:hypothetical protein
MRSTLMGLLLAAPATAIAALCDGPCSFTMDFAGGGSVTTSAGATLTFGAGGSLVLGTGGSITLGTGGSITPAVDPPDMSAGGTLVLGTGGEIQFGAGGSLGGGASGNIEVVDNSNVVVAGAASVTVDSAQSLHLGDLNAGGTVSVTAATLDDNDNSMPIHVDSTGDITVTSDAVVTFDSAAGTEVVLTATAAGGTGPGFSDCSEGCPAGGVSTIGSPAIPTEPGLPSSANTGAWSLLTLLPLALLGLLRRR